MKKEYVKTKIKEKKEQGEKCMKKFFAEFKKFITRGNVVDLAVGVIIGGAFTAIVTALTTHILTPLINWVIYLVFGGTTGKPVYTVLVGAYTEDGALDTANAIFINWGAFIGAIINFILIAFVLFMIIRFINRVQEANKKLAEGVNKGLTKEEKKEIKAAGISLKDKEKVAAFMADKKAKEDALKAEQAAKAEEERKHTTEGLLEDIKALLEKQTK